MTESTKTAVLRMIERLPDDVSIEDIMYHLYVREHIGKGLEDARAGRTISQDEMKRNLAEWLRSSGH